MRKIAGIVLLFTMFFMILIALMAFAFMELVPSELRNAFYDFNRSQSYYVSQSAIQGMSTWLRYQEDQGFIPTASLVGVPTGDPDWPMGYVVPPAIVPGLITTINDSAGNPDTSWSSTITLYSDVNTTAGISPHTYRVRVQTSRAYVSTFTSEYVVQQTTFAKYGFFVGNLPNSGYYPAGPSSGWGQYYGEFHVNGYMPLMVQSDLFSGRFTPAAAPIHGLMTFTQSRANAGNDSVYYQSGTVPFNGSGSELQVHSGAGNFGAYSLLMAQGRQAIQVVPHVEMPKTDVSSELPLARGAWFGRHSAADSLSSVSIPTGVNLPFQINSNNATMAGVYIKGDVQKMKLNVASSFTAPNNTSLNFVVQPRDAAGLISAGDPVIDIIEKAQAGTGKFTRIIELRDPAVTFTAPVGSYLYNATTGTRTLLAAPFPVASNTTVVCRQAGTTQNSGPADCYDVYPGYANGVIYVDGNLGNVTQLTSDQVNHTNNVDRERFTPSASASTGGVSGVNYGVERTIAVNLATNKYLRIDGNITRGDIAIGDPPNTSRRDGIGVVGYDIVLGQNNFVANTLYMYSLLMAGRLNLDGSATPGSVIYEGWPSQGRQSVLNVYGSYVVGNDRLWGTSSQGWVPNFYWDTALASSPPPFYPTRSDYVIQAYKEN